MKIDNTQSLSHTSYRCKYHIVIVPKYRRMVIYNRLRRDIIEILKTLIQRKPDVRIVERGKNYQVKSSTCSNGASAFISGLTLGLHKTKIQLFLNEVDYFDTDR